MCYTHTHTHTHITDHLLSSEGLKQPWGEVWPLLLEHARLVFQCGQALDRVAATLAPVLGGVEMKETLLRLLEASCGVEESLPPQPPLSSLSPSGDNTSSSSSSSSSISSEGMLTG